MKDKLLVERFSKLDVVLYLIERAYRESGHDHQLPVFQKMYNTTLRTWTRMADSLGLSPMARHQLRIDLEDRCTSLKEYLEIKGKSANECPKVGDTHKSEAIGKHNGGNEQ
jgi:hypothetical protein